MPELNPNSILFLYEGDTEKEFYNIVFENYLPRRRIRVTKKNLHGTDTNLNKKLMGKIIEHLDNQPDRHRVHVFIAIDREGPRSQESRLNLERLIKNLIYRESRVISVNEIIATQDFESWLFIDIKGIFKYLKVPISQRSTKKYNNHEGMQQLFLNRIRYHLNDLKERIPSLLCCQLLLANKVLFNGLGKKQRFVIINLIFSSEKQNP